jgi:hypothetical protein
MDHRWRTKWWAAVALVACLVSVAGVIGRPASVDAAGETGRITLTPVGLLFDTRLGLPIAAGVNLPLSSGLLTVSARPRAGGNGEADVFPCVGSPDSEPTFVFEDDGFVTRSIVVSPDVATCLRSTVAVDLVATRRGDVNGAPFVGGLQYQPLPTPEVVVAAPFTSTTITIPRGPSLPASAGGATYSIDLFGDKGSYAALQPCGQGNPVAADVGVAAGGYGLGIVNVALGAGQQACMTLFGAGYVEVTLLGALNTTGPNPARLPPQTTSRLSSVPPPGFAPITPDRAFDTRADDEGKLLPSEVLVVDLNDYLTGWSTAVTMNVTVTGAEGEGFLTVWPCDEAQPNASNLNFQAGVDVPNLVTVRLSVDGTVCIATSATTHVLGDIAGTYEFDDGVGSTAVTPERIVDTRRGFSMSAVPANGQRSFVVKQRAGVPLAPIEAITMNVTATGSKADGYLTVWPCDQPRPNASNLNFRRGVDVPNLVTVKVGPSGSICFFSTADTDVIVDDAAYFTSSSTGGFIDLVPDRLLDTRIPIGQPWPGKLGANGSLTLQVAGRGGVPASGAASVTMNVTAVSPDSGGYLTVWPCDQPRPDASNLNVQQNVNVPNLVSVKLSAAGTVCIFSTATTHVLADVAGYTTDVRIPYWDVVIV